MVDLFITATKTTAINRAECFHIACLPWFSSVEVVKVVIGVVVIEIVVVVVVVVVIGTVVVTDLIISK